MDRDGIRRGHVAGLEVAREAASARDVFALGRQIAEALAHAHAPRHPSSRSEVGQHRLRSRGPSRRSWTSASPGRWWTTSRRRSPAPPRRRIRPRHRGHAALHGAGNDPRRASGRAIRPVVARGGAVRVAHRQAAVSTVATPSISPAAIVNGPPVQLPDSMPAPLAAVVARLLSRDPRERYGTAAEVAAALDSLSRRDRATAHCPRQRVATLWPVLAIVLLAPGAYVVWRLRRPSLCSSPSSA